MMKYSAFELRSRLWIYGQDILLSEGMQRSRQYLHHGTCSVYEHSVSVARTCLYLANRMNLTVDERALVRGALLHDYFLYDWHEKDPSHAWHGFHHASVALRNACRDFSLGEIEQDMIYCHMFPLNPRLPRYREGWILILADKLCSGRETITGHMPRFHRKAEAGKQAERRHSDVFRKSREL